MTKTNMVATLPIEVADINAAASATAAGIVELAIDSEVITGTDAVRAVTPAGLQAKVASATAKGIVELAIDAEAKTGTDTTRAITATNLRAVLSGLKFISFAGRNGQGSISAVGAVAGDKVIDVVGISAGHLGRVGTLFENPLITVNDQIQQTSASDLSVDKLYVAVLLAVV